MADVFISYARQDRECAELLARALAARGWNVWWDREIRVGSSFSEVIERELDRARCVVVLWSSASLQSQWVQNEAAEAAARKALVPVRIEDVRPPLEFRRLQTADFLDWRSGFDSPAFEACIQSIEMLAEAATQFVPMTPPPVSRQPAPPRAQPVAPPPMQPQPQQPQYQPPQPQQQPQQNIGGPASQQFAYNSGAVALSIPNYMTQAVLVTLCCCMPIGIIALFNAAQVNSKLARGDVIGAKSSSETTRTLCWIGVIGGAVVFALYLMGGFFNLFSTR